MSRIQQIILDARDTLADTSEQRWTDERLLKLVSEAQEDIVIHNELLKASVSIPIVTGQAIYALPDDCYMILRASVDSREIPLLTYTVMDESARREAYTNDRSDSWERDRGFFANSDFDSQTVVWEDSTGKDVEALIYDNRNPLEIRVYPIPDDTITHEDYTFENAGTVIFVGDEMLGVAVDIETDGLPDYTFDSPYGGITDMADPLISFENFLSDFGIVTDMSETQERFTIWYTKAPPRLASLTEELSVPMMYDRAMKYYVIGHAYDDDNDTKNEAKSEKALRLYAREFELAARHSRKDGVSTPNIRTHYRSAFE